MKKQLILIFTCMLMALSGLAQSGKFESNECFSYTWDEHKDEYVSVGGSDNTTKWVMYYDSNKNSIMILVSNDKIIGVEEIIYIGYADRKTFYDGNKGTRIMYAQEDGEDFFIVYYDKDDSGRYQLMFVFTGTHKKMSGKKIKKETRKIEFAPLQEVVKTTDI